MSWLYWGVPLMIIGLAVGLFPLLFGQKRQAGLVEEEREHVERARRALGRRPVGRR